MSGHPSCARCGRPVRAPGIWSNSWRCEVHEDVEPLAPVGLPTRERIERELHAGPSPDVPFWLPWPLPTGWLATGITHAGDDRHGVRATAVAFTGPNPVGGPADLVIVAEEPGVGLGARCAGLAGPDPGTDIATQVPHAKIAAAGHPTALWCVPGAPDRAVYVGEALGCWLWLILTPASAGALVADHITLIDLRDAPCDLDLPLGPALTTLPSGPDGPEQT
ncbi:DUF6758 family protein [Sporichthya brevicatena]|uniref:DUF6758 family protein n=1 Tax=Sporichthya brevicatena TaxID=171442 RepID=UPI0031E29054